MSCFQGQMSEYKNVALDRFDGKNLKCTAFFLSHCHKDHMVGLNFSSFHERLKSRSDVFLYCTEISRLLLLADEDYRHLEKYITVLDVGESRYLRIPGPQESKEDIYATVTPISAGHCLGSVMFLFEGGEGTVIYTGDFRWEADQAARISAFRYQESVKNIQAMYVDTTFCIPEAFHIPTRNECVEAAHSLIADWLNKGLCNAVSISCPARFGHEHFLLELAKRLHTKIHVPSWKVAIYNNIPELQGYFTDDASETKLHSCATRSGFTKTTVLPCGHRLPNGERLRLLNMRPSTMWFTSSKTKCSTGDLVVAPATQRGLHRVCYSMHSSYSEIRDFVSFIKPKKVSPNVLPASDKDMTTVQKRLESFIEHPNKFRLQSSPDGQASLIPLGTLRQMQRNATNYSRPESFESGSDDLVFSSQELSPCKRSTSLHHHGVKTAAATTTTTITTTPATNALTPDRKPQSSPTSPISPSSSRPDISMESSHSSYSGSANGGGDGEIDLFSDEDNDDAGEDSNAHRLQGGEDEKDDNDDAEKNERAEKLVKDNTVGKKNEDGKSKTEEESLRSYVSGESEVEENSDDDGDDNDDEKMVVCYDKNQEGTSVGNKEGCGENDPNFLDFQTHSALCKTDADNVDIYVKSEESHNRLVGIDESNGVDMGGGGASHRRYKRVENGDCDSTLSYDATVTDCSLSIGSIVGQHADLRQSERICNADSNQGKDGVGNEILDNDQSTDTGGDDNEDDDVDDDIIPNSQENTTDEKDSGYRISSAKGQRRKTFRKKEHMVVEIENNQNLSVFSRRGEDVDCGVKDECGSSGSQGVETKKKNDQEQDHPKVLTNPDLEACQESDEDCEIIDDEELDVLVIPASDDYVGIGVDKNKQIQSNATTQSIQSNFGSSSSKKSEMLSFSQNSKDVARNLSKADVIDVEENESIDIEEDSDDCVEFLGQDNTSTSPSKRGWLSKAKNNNKRRHLGVTIDALSSDSEGQGKSNVSVKRKKVAEKFVGKSSWSSKYMKGRNRFGRIEEDMGDSIGNTSTSKVEASRESVVDLTLDLEDSL